MLHAILLILFMYPTNSKLHGTKGKWTTFVYCLSEVWENLAVSKFEIFVYKL